MSGNEYGGASIPEKLGFIKGQMQGVKDDVASLQTDVKDLHKKYDDGQKEILTAIAKPHPCHQEGRIQAAEDGVDHTRGKVTSIRTDMEEMGATLEPIATAFQTAQNAQQTRREAWTAWGRKKAMQVIELSAVAIVVTIVAVFLGIPLSKAFISWLGG